ncbi:MAG TPA: ABC transporter ATP-binding protein [Acidimicrobiales bacterium]|nr:ABC transporter ATP-binding protein [Acidimicrobiales bacterium]
MTAAIEAHDLTRTFGENIALDGLTLELQAGEVLALLGPNGAGKTTTVRLLNGVLKPDRGRARVLGLDPLVDGEELRRRTGVLTEGAGLDDRLTARENLTFVAQIRGLRGRQGETRVDDLLGRFGMIDRANDKVQGFSTGQRKRLALARALLHDPEVLFLDEPTSGLDPAATRDVIDLLGSLAAEHGRTVVLCTHFLGEAGRLAHRMAVLHHGQLHAYGRPDELAARLWDGVDADVDLGAPADDRTVALLVELDGVQAAETTASGLRVRVDDREAMAAVVAMLVAREVPVYGAVPRTPTLEDVYFAVEAQFRKDRADGHG